MSNNKGFSLIEVLVAFSILFMIITTLIPIMTMLNKERQILSDRRIISSMLYEELQPYLWISGNTNTVPVTYKKTIKKIDVEVTFRHSSANQLIKGCMEWENVKRKTEKICLYGNPQG